MLVRILCCHSCKHILRKKSADNASYKEPMSVLNDPSALAATSDKAPAKDIYILATIKRLETTEVAFLYWMRTKPSY